MTPRHWGPDYKKGDKILLRRVELIRVPKDPEESTPGWYAGDGFHWVCADTKKRAVPGDVFFLPDGLDKPLFLSPRYHAPSRPPIIIVLPSFGPTMGYPDHGQWWCVDELSSRDIQEQERGGKIGLGWHVTDWEHGPDKITVTPSILTGVYHAQVVKGVLVPYSDSKV